MTEAEKAALMASIGTLADNVLFLLGIDYAGCMAREEYEGMDRLKRRIDNLNSVMVELVEAKKAAAPTGAERES